jgi:hypothetical protein
MNRSELQAFRLASLASTERITYVPTGLNTKIGRRVWYGMIATDEATNETWNYWLSPEQGSYMGSHNI